MHPDLGCINTVHPAHLQGLGSLAGVAAAKGELFHAMRPEAVRVVNEDDPRIWRIAEASGGSRIGFALTEAGLARHPLVSVRDLENPSPADLPIDEKTKADQRRAVRKLYDTTRDIFDPYIKCEMPAIYAAEIIKDELMERIDYNCMREKLTSHERAGYIQDDRDRKSVV